MGKLWNEKEKQKRRICFFLCLILLIFMTGCSQIEKLNFFQQSTSQAPVQTVSETAQPAEPEETGGQREEVTDPVTEMTTNAAAKEETTEEAKTEVEKTPVEEAIRSLTAASKFSLDGITLENETLYYEINGNQPYFTEKEFVASSFEYYSELDSLGRCGVVCANISQDMMPTEPRAEIGDVRPSGWHTVRYDDLIEDRYLYNRCHLIAYMLTGENANEKNLITGTRYFNETGMLLYENKVASYVNRTGNVVLYRVTPVYDGNDLVARGVLMEAASVEDQGAEFHFNVFVQNIQPGITIDYATGDSAIAAPSVIDLSGAGNGQTAAEGQTSVNVERVTEEGQSELSTEAGSEEKIEAATVPEREQESETSGYTYVLNTNTYKFHHAYCLSVSEMQEKNKQYSNEDRDTIIGWGYVPCKRCNP